MREHTIHLEGADKVGKSTLKKLLVKGSKGKYLIHDRSYLSQIAYARLYDRYLDEEYYWDRMLSSYKNHEDKFFMIYCDVNDVERRFALHHETDIHISEFEKHQNIFHELVEEAKHRGIEMRIISSSQRSSEYTYRNIQYHILCDDMKECSACELCKREVNVNDLPLGTGKLIPNAQEMFPVYLLVGMNPSNNRIPFTEHPFAVNIHENKNQIFLEILQELRIYNKCILTNSVKCSTSNNKISQKDFDNCIHHLKDEIEVFKPTYLVALGSDVYHLLFNACVNDNLFDKKKILKIYHPSYQYGYGKITPEAYTQHIKEKLINDII